MHKKEREKKKRKAENSMLIAIVISNEIID